MKYLLTRNNIAELDQACINEVPGMTSALLMENAGRAAANILRTLMQGATPKRILIACGGGNNGGDGLMIARHLRDDHDVMVLRNDDPEWDELVDSFDVIVDALVGVGGGADLRMPASQHVATLNSLRGLHVAIDVPTGLDATTGEAHQSAFKAHATITMAASKPGFYRNDGPSRVGTVYIADIGAPTSLIEQFAKHFILTPNDIRTWLPRRLQNTSKFDYGRVLVIGGTREMRGAPALAAHAALVAGAGIVDLAAPLLHPLIPREVMTHVLNATVAGEYPGTIALGALNAVQDIVQKATVVAIGPGIGRSAESITECAAFVNALRSSIPVVIDADGLRMLPLLKRDMKNVILTPHLGEFARMLGCEVSTIRRNVVEEAMHFAKANGCILHVKDVPSITTNGTEVFYTVNGNPGMATAGSGDVLTGIIAGLCAQHVNAMHATALGAYLHARAGDSYAETSALETLTATDLIHALGSVIPV